MQIGKFIKCYIQKIHKWPGWVNLLMASRFNLMCFSIHGSTWLRMFRTITSIETKQSVQVGPNGNMLSTRECHPIPWASSYTVAWICAHLKCINFFNLYLDSGFRGCYWPNALTTRLPAATHCMCEVCCLYCTVKKSARVDAGYHSHKEMPPWPPVHISKLRCI
jgi:hypothetical protein